MAEDDGSRVGYIANSANTKANGTMSAARIYDKVGDFFWWKFVSPLRLK